MEFVDLNGVIQNYKNILERYIVYLDSVIGQLTSHAFVSGQYASSARVVVVHFAELTVVCSWKSMTDV